MGIVKFHWNRDQDRDDLSATIFIIPSKYSLLQYLEQFSNDYMPVLQVYRNVSSNLFSQNYYNVSFHNTS